MLIDDMQLAQRHPYSNCVVSKYNLVWLTRLVPLRGPIIEELEDVYT
ncbi:MAG: hypothetical protein RTU09_04205 [Candidatus Thorarchaeota archaeon]